MAVKGKADSISITPPKSFPQKIIFTPGGSKSISNRALLLSALSSDETEITGLSSSEDTIIMKRLLQQEGGTFDAGHAGTCFRFMTAYLGIRPGSQILTGSERMKKRPIGPLVEALKTIGILVKYLERTGYPPIEIGSFEPEKYNKNVRIRGDVSSQFISALMMVAPHFPEGLQIEVIPPFVSFPYVEMTAAMMRDFGVVVEMDGHIISVHHGKYSRKSYNVEADWSSASYPIGLMALVRKGELKIPGLSERSMQGDSVLLDIAKDWGLKVEFENSSLLVSATEGDVKKVMSRDFSNSPDLAPTVMSVNAALGISGRYTGVQTLRLKESDRIYSMQICLEKVGVKLRTNESESGGELIALQEGEFQIPENLSIDPFDDHRIAMACSIWSIFGEVRIENSGVVVKSFPDFWDQMGTAGFKITRPG